LNSKAQTWIFDFIVGFLMFVFLLFLSVNLLKSVDAKSSYEVINREVDFVSVALMSPGFPEYWNSSSVVVPGLLSNNEVDMAKLQLFDSFSYTRSKALLRVTGEYWFYFKNASGIIEVNGKCVRGFDFEGCEIPEVTARHSDRAWTERIVLLDSQIVSLVVVGWR
jgi:hypothetical protein